MDFRCCWHKEHITAADCPALAGHEGDLLVDRRQRFLQLCLECPQFREDLRNMGEEDDALAGFFPLLVDELLACRGETKDLAGQIEAHNRESRFLHEVGQVLQTSLDMDEVIAMALTALTAGSGFGLNRAILLLVDKERQNLCGYLAVGPTNREDAGRIWQEIAESDYPLREMARHLFEEKLSAEREKFRTLLERLTVPLERHNHPFVRALDAPQSRLVRDLCGEGLDRLQAEALGVDEMVLVPLRSRQRRIGLLMADNIITGRPISTVDLHSLETFAMPVAFAIERAALYERLQEELEKLTEANRRLREQQSLILRMEKMALVGNLTASIAHSIRNPLTIIGGFARTLTRNTASDDPRRPYVDSIVREARRLDEALQEVLNYSESLHPTFDLWDVNRLIDETHAALQEELDLAGLACRLDLDPDLPLVGVDIKKLTYCLRSIFRQTLASMSSGGEMTIRSARAGGEVHVTVTHHGTPLSPEVLKGVTAPAFSGDGQCGGPGLALCSRILTEHGAGLDIDSSEEHGTTFTIRLPLPKEKNHGPTAGG